MKNQYFNFFPLHNTVDFSDERNSNMTKYYVDRTIFFKLHNETSQKLNLFYTKS